MLTIANATRLREAELTLGDPLRLGASLNSPLAGKCACTSWTDDVPILAIVVQTALRPVLHPTLEAGFFGQILVRPVSCILAEAKIFELCKELLAEFAEACGPSVGLAVGGLGFPFRRGLISAGEGW